jgi:hypothetical protein
MQTHKLPILLSRNTVKHAVGYSNAGYDINRRVNRHTGAHPNTNNTGTQHKDTQPYRHSNIHTCMHEAVWRRMIQPHKKKTILQWAQHKQIENTDTRFKLQAYMHICTQAHRYRSRKDIRNRHTPKDLQPFNTTRRNTGTGAYKHTAMHPHKYTTM